MLYTKPKDIRYVDMCIWIDENAYKDDCNDEKLFEYLYHICNMLAYKRRFFKRSRYYEDFAIYFASQLYLRLRSQKQFELKNAETGEYRLDKIKSILNYAKTKAYPAKVAFEQQEYYQSIYIDDNEQIISEQLSDTIARYIDDISIIEFSDYLNSIKGVLTSFLDALPWYYSKVDKLNIQMSCILSLLVQILPKNYDNISQNLKKENTKEKYLLNALENTKNDIILYHLDNSMRQFILTLVNQLKQIISADLQNILHSQTPSNYISHKKYTYSKEE